MPWGYYNGSKGYSKKKLIFIHLYSLFTVNMRNSSQIVEIVSNIYGLVFCENN